MTRALVAISLTACGGIGAEVDYAEARASAECAQLERCSRGYFDSTYPSEKDCVHDLKEQIGQSDDLQQQSHCDYLPDEAGRCVSRLKSLSCEEYALGYESKACDLVWHCDGGIRYPTYPTFAGGI